MRSLKILFIKVDLIDIDVLSIGLLEYENEAMNSMEILIDKKNKAQKLYAIERIIRFIKTNFKEDYYIIGHKIDKDIFLINRLFKEFDDDIYNYLPHEKIDTMIIANYLKSLGKLSNNEVSTYEEENRSIFNIRRNKDRSSLEKCYTTVKLYELLNSKL